MGHESLPVILGVDVARQGGDSTVIALRQGRYSKILFRAKGLSTVETEEKVVEFMRSKNADACVIDGDGFGGSVIDHLKNRGYGAKVHEFHGAHKANNRNVYFNRRAEIWGLLRDALNNGMQLPGDESLLDDLTSCQYQSDEKGIHLMPKDKMRAHGMDSPDAGDALAMTFAVSIAAKKKEFQPTVGRTYGADAWMM